MVDQQNTNLGRRIRKARDTMLKTVLTVLSPFVSGEELSTDSTYNLDILSPEDMEECYFPLVCKAVQNMVNLSK